MTTQTNKNEIRATDIGTFDVLKGFLLISVIVYHNWWGSYFHIHSKTIAGITDVICKYFLVACMPCLFILSGFGFRKRPFKKVFCQQNQKLQPLANRRIH